jgi:hypothetical protein
MVATQYSRAYSTARKASHRAQVPGRPKGEVAFDKFEDKPAEDMPADDVRGEPSDELGSEIKEESEAGSQVDEPLHEIPSLEL